MTVSNLSGDRPTAFKETHMTDMQMSNGYHGPVEVLKGKIEGGGGESRQPTGSHVDSLYERSIAR